MTAERRQNISIKAIERWKSKEFREKTTAHFKKTKSIRSQKSKTIWQRPAYRQLKTKQSQELWLNDEYVASQAKGMQSIDTRLKLATIRAAQANKPSSIELQLYRYLDDLGITYYKEGPETKIGYFVFDCLIPASQTGKKNLLIECQGNYWHALPRTERCDKSKFTYIDRYFPNHEIMYIWEHEFATENRVLDRLKSKLGVDLQVCDFTFDQLIVKRIADNIECRSFLDAYHYIGRDRGGLLFGAYLNKTLVACVVYSPPLRQNTASSFNLNDIQVRELSRFCIHPNYHKRNFASWFIAKTMKQVKADLIIAYADRTVGHIGTIYRAANSKEHHRVPPDYWYVDENGYIMYKRTLYGKARTLKLTETEFAVKYGYHKQYGGEKICFVYHLDQLN